MSSPLHLPSGFKRSEPAQPRELQFLRAALGRLPAELVSLLQVANGAQGVVRSGAPGQWLVLYSAQEIVIINRQFRRNLAAAEDLLVFASDGGRRLAAFDLSLNPPLILALPFSLVRADVSFRCATVAELLQILERSGWEWPGDQPG